MVALISSVNLCFPISHKHLVLLLCEMRLISAVRVGEDLPLRYLHAAKVIFISVFLTSCRWIKDLVLVIKFGSPPVGSLIP